LVVYYLWLIEPFAMQLQAMVRGQEEFGSSLWEPEPEEEWEDNEGDDDGEREDIENKEREDIENKEREDKDREAREVELIDSDVDIVEEEEEQREDINKGKEDN